MDKWHFLSIIGKTGLIDKKSKKSIFPPSLVKMAYFFLPIALLDVVFLIDLVVNNFFKTVITNLDEKFGPPKNFEFFRINFGRTFETFCRNVEGKFFQTFACEFSKITREFRGEVKEISKKIFGKFGGISEKNVGIFFFSYLGCNAPICLYGKFVDARKRSFARETIKRLKQNFRYNIECKVEKVCSFSFYYIANAMLRWKGEFYSLQPGIEGFAKRSLWVNLRKLVEG